MLFVVSAAYLLSFSHYGINLWDEGGLYQGALRYMDGQKVYEDFHGYTPGRYYLAEAAFRLFGPGMLSVRQLFAIGSGLFAVFAFQICRRFMPPLYTTAAVLLVVSVPAVYYQRFYGLAFLFNMWAVMVFLENRRNFPWLLLAAAYSYFFKNEVLLVAGPVYLYLLWEQLDGRMRKWFTVALAALVFMLVYERKMLEIVYYELPAAYSMWSNPLPMLWEGYQGREFGLFSLGENLLFYLPFLTGVSLLVISLKSGGGKQRRLMAVLGYFQLAAMSLVLMRAGFDNLVRCLPLFFITACYLAYRVAGSGRINSVKAAPQSIRKKAAAVLFGALFLFYMVDFNFANGFYAGSIGAVRDTDAKLEGGRVAGIRVHHTDAAIISEVTKWITAATRPDEPIFALPLNPIWYYLTGRKNPTYHDWVLPSSFTRPGDETKLLAQLDGNPPALIILVDLEIDNVPERRLKNYAPLLTGWIQDNYRYNGRVAYFQIWKRNADG